MQPSIRDREDELRRMAEEFGQNHLFAWWKELGENERTGLLEQITAIDFPLVKDISEKLVTSSEKPGHVELVPAPIIRIPDTGEQKKEAKRAAERGESMLSQGKVAPLVVAGGQGTRLGFDGPKGAFPIGPISEKCLFAFFAEKILACRKRYGVLIPWYIMTSPANNAETREYFRKNGWFGMKEDQVFFFVQGTMPAVDPHGKILLASQSQIAVSPDGHGGTLRALVAGGALKDMEDRGITEISYFQVDNVLIKALDPVFIGHHSSAGAEMSSKVLRKAFPEEKVGIVGMRNGRLGVIEYSDLSKEDMYAKGADGELKYWAGSIAIHMIQVAFVRRLHSQGIRLPFHRADKKVPCIDVRGNPVTPDKPNGIKFESFIFDALEHAKNPVTMEVVRNEEFSPVKNASGFNSPETAQRDLMELFATWLEKAGANVPRNKDGSLAVKIEISPLFALDLEEALSRMKPPLPVIEDLYISG